MNDHDPLVGLPVGSRPPSSAARWIAPLAILGVLVGAAGVALWAHNGMRGREEAVHASWAQVESNVQRRADLVPQLVEVVGKAMRHESEVLDNLTRVRAGAAGETGRVLADLSRAHTASQQDLHTFGGAAPLDPAHLRAFQRHEASVGRGIQQVLAVAESYPVLRSSDQLLELQAQLEGSENRINAARMGFNETVRAYNAALVQVPMSWFAGTRERRPYFEADADTHQRKPLGLE